MIISLLIQSMDHAFIFISFKINQDYIVEKLCINREKPEMNCKGHCQLKKQMKEEEKRKKESPARLEVKNAIILIKPGIHIKFNSYNYPEKEFEVVRCASKPRSFIPDIFHPPKFNS